ncbi:MAG: TIGR00159 family protein [Bacteroidales bacterium]|nr:TIGR00159 family protein [Bacteroidales bacterium]
MTEGTFLSFRAKSRNLLQLLLLSLRGYIYRYMFLGAFEFIQMSFADILDIILLGLIIFLAFRWLKGSSAISIFLAIVSLYLIRVLVSAFNMRLIEAILSMILDVGVIAFIVIFQPEIRKLLTRLGNRYMGTSKGRDILDKLLGRKTSHTEYGEEINNITEACRRMSEEKTGALIVISRSSPLDDIISTGDKIDASIHRRLIMNLFFKNSPLHDGALVISGDRIVAARCTLPITERTDVPANFGMRHKAAIGITEETDADAIVVSEETGKISFVRSGIVTPITNINELKLMLNSSVGQH